MKFEIIPTKGILYDKCENVEQLYDNYYYPLLVEFKQLQNNWNELMEDIPHILEIIEHNKDVIKVTSDEELAIYSLQNKMQELEQDKDE